MMRSDSPEWVAAKAEGDRAELAVAHWFRQRGFDPYRTVGNVKFDLLLQASVEVKHDLRAEETGNVAVEVSYSGRPSGIMNSDAQYWAVVVGEEAFIIKTRRLRELVLGGKFREVAAGDGGKALVRLVPIERLRAVERVQIVRLTREAMA